MDINFIPPAARAEYSGIQYARIARTDREQVRRHTASFDVRDAKGREMGYMYAIDREFWVIDAASHTIVPVERVEDHLEETFIVYPHGLRNGAKFGAIPVASHKRFRTLAEAEAYADKSVERARKAAAKKASA
jgi:hypothetical protein